MSVVASVDYDMKRIYLSSSTVGVSLDTLDIYREVRSLRRTNESHRKYKPMVLSGGNIQKTQSTFTQPYVILMYGCRIVPYNVSQHLRVIRETFTDDGFAGRDCFDRLPLSPTVEVDIDYDIDKVEIRTIFSDANSNILQNMLNILQNVDIEINDLKLDNLTITDFKRLLFNKVSSINNKKIISYLAGGDTNIVVQYNQDGIPISETII